MEKLNQKIQQKFNDIQKLGKLFVSSLTGQQVWELYIKGFGNDPKFRDPASSVHNCNHCKNFIRRYGNIVGIDVNNNIVTMFDIENAEEEYADSVKLIANMLKAVKIKDVFFETLPMLKSLPYESCKPDQPTYRLGIDKNTKRYTKEEAELYGVVKPNEIRRFHHLHVNLNCIFVATNGESQEAIAARYRSAKEVFMRAMQEIPTDTYKLVRDLIAQGSLLDGATHVSKVNKMLELKEKFNSVPEEDKDSWCWSRSFKLNVAKFKNELIGTLCSELAEGEELNSAVTKWNKRVDPVNYMKVKSPITQTQINNAKKFVEDNGYTESFNRRLAIIEDIKASEIRHINAGNGAIEEVNIFDNVKATKKSSHSRAKFDGIDEVSIEVFMKDILPKCTSVELYLENKHELNMVTLTTARTSSAPIFKWDNNYSWTYSGNLAGKSQLTEMVKIRGGRIDGVFRFTHSWNELEPNKSLMDLHVFFPKTKHVTGVHDNYGSPAYARIGWNNRADSITGGKQDVDYVEAAPKGFIPVENITFPSINRLKEGAYVCKIHNWAYRQSGGRGKAEIAIGNELYQYIYPATSNKEWVDIATVTLKNGKFTIEHHIPEVGDTEKEIYGLTSKNFHKVNLVCLSPNHWGGNSVGNKHYFFMLDKCVSPEPVVGFHTENLIPKLATHRKVIEVLSMTNTIKSTKNQLSGLGFNATVKDSVILRLKGSFNRMVKVNF